MDDGTGNLSSIVGELFSSYDIVDLSKEIYPGVLKPNGAYHWGKGVRRFELRQFIAPGPHYMHFVETETHVGTHVELPSHMYENGKSSAEMPLRTFWGEGCLFAAKEGKRVFTAEDVAAAKSGDIALFYAPAGKGASVSVEATRLMAERGVKMIGEENVGVSNDVHEILLSRDIPIIEQLAHLDEIRSQRFLFVGLPLRVFELESSWIRAMALVPKGKPA